MAKQHFYSRVPARMSMYYKSNGYDTFASSSGIDQYYVEKSFSSILEQKPTAEEYKLIRQNQLAPIYLHYLNSDGDMILSCISFLAKDYSEERTAYLIHSLILNKSEEEKIHYSNEVEAINPDLFLHNLDSFAVLDPKSRANKDYEEKEIIANQLNTPISSYFEKYDRTMVMRFIFALFGAITGKYKSLNVVLPNNKNSEESLIFFNNVLAILPFHLRKYVSFVSMVNDFNKYTNFKLKIIHQDLGDAPTNKGVTINFITNQITGVKENDYQSLSTVSELFYHVIDHDNERDELFKFFSYAYNQLEVELKPLDQKTLIESILLFKAGSGLYEEYKIVPTDESVIALFDAYSKQRFALTEDYRRNIVKTLKRYPETYRIIPKQVFSKIVSLYSTETPGTKHIIMNVCLDLIHTDLMRKQLFSFIKANYDKEDQDTQNNIILNLCKVFNGEFLQIEIIAFLSKHFEDKPLEIRKIILETLLLSIRTADIQEQLFNFFNSKYDILTIEEKSRLYEEIAMHLPEGDELTKRLVQMCDQNIIKESNELKVVYSRSLFKLIDAEQKQKVDLLLPLVAETEGFTFEQITSALFSKRTFRLVSTKFIIMSMRGTLHSRVTKIITMWRLANQIIEEKMTRKFTRCVLTGFTEYPCPCTIQEIYQEEERIEKEFKDYDSESYETFSKAFKENVLNKLIIESLVNIYKSTEPNEIEKLIEYTKDNEQVKNAPNYSLLTEYVKLKQSIKNLDYSTYDEVLQELSNDPYAKRIGFYINVDLLNQYDKNDETYSYNPQVMLTMVAINVLRSSHLKLSSCYDSLEEELNKQFEDNKENELTIQTLNAKICLMFLEFVYNLKQQSSKFYDDAKSSDTGISVIAGNIVLNYGKKQLQVLLNNFNDKEFVKFITDSTKMIKSRAGLFSKVVKV